MKKDIKPSVCCHSASYIESKTYQTYFNEVLIFQAAFQTVQDSILTFRHEPKCNCVHFRADLVIIWILIDDNSIAALFTKVITSRV